MNIKQLKFDIGEELNIRECPKLKTKSIDELQALVSEGTMIVKCGRAYYDVSNRIDIYEHEQAEELDISSLTSIDRKDKQENGRLVVWICSSDVFNCYRYLFILFQADNDIDIEMVLI